MLDLVFILITIGYFVGNAAVAYGFDRLMGGRR
jgi:hypothetical protein